VDAADDDGRGGRGVGKTMLVVALAHLVGGHIDARPGEDIDKLMTRLLSSAALDRRVARWTTSRRCGSRGPTSKRSSRPT
jgi:hypothetical protein